MDRVPGSSSSQLLSDSLCPKVVTAIFTLSTWTANQAFPTLLGEIWEWETPCFTRMLSMEFSPGPKMSEKKNVIWATWGRFHLSLWWIFKHQVSKGLLPSVTKLAALWDTDGVSLLTLLWAPLVRSGQQWGGWRDSPLDWNPALHSQDMLLVHSPSLFLLIHFLKGTDTVVKWTCVTQLGSLPALRL